MVLRRMFMLESSMRLTDRTWTPSLFASSSLEIPRATILMLRWYCTSTRRPSSAAMTASVSFRFLPDMVSTLPRSRWADARDGSTLDGLAVLGCLADLAASVALTYRAPRLVGELLDPHLVAE